MFVVITAPLCLTPRVNTQTTTLLVGVTSILIDLAFEWNAYLIFSCGKIKREDHPHLIIKIQHSGQCAQGFVQMIFNASLWLRMQGFDKKAKVMFGRFY